MHHPERKRKKEVRDFLFSFFTDMHLRKIVGLAGPHIQDYIEYCKSKGYTQFEIYEKDPITALHQLGSLKDSGIQIKLKDVIDANSEEPETLYDLDYCGTIRYLKDHVAKFKDKFIMTFCSRVSKVETITTFFSVREETVLEEQEILNPIKHTQYFTDKGIYIYLPYRDVAPMCCIAKIA